MMSLWKRKADMPRCLSYRLRIIRMRWEVVSVDKTKEKISIGRIISNYIYILKYAFKKDASLILLIFGAMTAGGVGYACMETIFLRVFINYLSGERYSFEETCIRGCCYYKHGVTDGD